MTRKAILHALEQTVERESQMFRELQFWYKHLANHNKHFPNSPTDGIDSEISRLEAELREQHLYITQLIKLLIS